MTLRTFNYTGRARITNLRIRISQAERKILELHIPDDSLSKCQPEDSVWLEASRAGSLESIRFSLGTVGNPTSAAGLDYSSLGCSDPVFSVKVVDGCQPGGRITGLSTYIAVDSGEDAGGRSLLPVNIDDELRDRAWRLTFDTSGPRLSVSGRIPNPRDFAASNSFTALVLPELFRQVLHKILIEERYFDTETMENWRAKWLRCAMDMRSDRLLPDEPEESDDEGWEEIKNWIYETVTAFEEKTGLFHQLVAELKEAAE